MLNRWVLGSLCLIAACAAPAQSYPQISVTVANGNVTVTPVSYKFAKGQPSVNVVLGTRGYTITNIQFTSGSGLFSCTPQSGNTTWTCLIGTRDPGASANYTVTVSNGTTPSTSPTNVLTQNDD